MVTATLPDRNLAAEAGVLGAMLNNRDAVRFARLELTAASFYQPVHAAMFDAMCHLDDNGVPVDMTTVTAEMIRRRQHEQIRNGVLVAELWEHGAAAGTVGYHAQQIRAAARVRALQEAHSRLGQALEHTAATGDDESLLNAAAMQSVALQLAADGPTSDAPVDGLSTWDQFLAARTSEAEWIVPGLLRKHDTVMILAAPGAGKSFLSRQVCTSLAAGIHPFKLDRIEPVRTLLVDLENAPGQVAEEAGPLVGQVKRLGRWDDDRGWIWAHPEGLNLRQHADAALFERVIAETRPQVVAFGSLYNAYKRGRDDWDTAAEDVQSVLKRIRARYGLAFWLEHHMPYAPGGHTGTPFGGTSWAKWPTHGRVLKRAADTLPIYLLEADTFRGDRGQRDIPLALCRGGRLPWEAIYEQADLELRLEASESRRPA